MPAPTTTGVTATTGDPLRVVGRYAVYHEIAAGGMATVHLGRLLTAAGPVRPVAIKRLHRQFAKDPEFSSMFLDEARLAARVKHPNVVPTIDVVATGGELFLVMEYVRGESLAKLIRLARKRKEPIPPHIAAAVMCGFLHGLHAAHEATDERGVPLGLIHRDVSPQNVLVGTDGVARVLDFGIAKAAGRLQVTLEGQVKGKLSYMPPEQVSGKPLTRAADVYASAVVMWETLTCERLFKGKSEVETLAKILREPVPPPSDAPGVTDAFDDVLLKALSRDPTKRHATARDLAFEIERRVPVASAAEVGAWVEQLAGPLLGAREAQLAEVASGGPMSTPPPPLEWDSTSDVSSPDGPSTRGGTARFAVPVAARPPEASRPSATPAPRGAAAAVLVVLAAVFVVVVFGAVHLAPRLAARLRTGHLDAGPAPASRTNGPPATKR